MTTKEFTVTITGFRTLEQAQAFANWYEGQGEQDAIAWFENQEGLGATSFPTDVRHGIQTAEVSNVTLKVTPRE